jgi:hypothetical protein
LHTWCVCTRVRCARPRSSPPAPPGSCNTRRQAAAGCYPAIWSPLPCRPPPRRGASTCRRCSTCRRPCWGRSPRFRGSACNCRGPERLRGPPLPSTRRQPRWERGTRKGREAGQPASAPRTISREPREPPRPPASTPRRPPPSWVVRSRRHRASRGAPPRSRPLRGGRRAPRRDPPRRRPTRTRQGAGGRKQMPRQPPRRSPRIQRPPCPPYEYRRPGGLLSFQPWSGLAAPLRRSPISHSPAFVRHSDSRV